jgi:hypothetical protein
MQLLGDVPSEELVRMRATETAVVAYTSRFVWIFDHELDPLGSAPMTGINALDVGPHAVWLREITGDPRYDAKAGIAVADVRFARIALDDSVSTLEFGGGLDALWVDGAGPDGFDLMMLGPATDEAVGISSRASRGLRGWKRHQVLARLTPEIGLGMRPDTIKIDAAPWVRQVGMAGRRPIMSTTNGLYAGREGQALVAPDALTVLLNPAPYPFAEWVMTRRGAFAVTASDDEMVVYGFSGGSVDPIARYPLSVVTLPAGSFFADIDGPRHVAAVADEHGAWLPLISDGQGALMHVGDDGTCSEPLAFDEPILPIGADGEFVYCVTGRDDGLSDVIAVPCN